MGTELGTELCSVAPHQPVPWEIGQVCQVSQDFHVGMCLPSGWITPSRRQIPGHCPGASWPLLLGCPSTSNMGFQRMYPMTASTCIQCQFPVPGSTVCIQWMHPTPVSNVCIHSMEPMVASTLCIQWMHPAPLSRVCIQCMEPTRASNICVQHVFPCGSNVLYPRCIRVVSNVSI